MDSAPHYRSPLLIAVAVLVSLGACAAVLTAFATKSLICQGDAGSECRSGLMTLQLFLSLAGLVPIGAMLSASFHGRNGLAIRCLTGALVLYLGWAVLNDAAVHGWSDLKIF